MVVVAKVRSIQVTLVVGEELFIILSVYLINYYAAGLGLFHAYFLN